MSKLNKLSVFYFGTTVTKDNQYIDFDEGGPELNAVIKTGDYTLQGYALAVEEALNLAGALTYTVTLNRTTRVLTIAASGTFTLRCNTGSHTGNNAWSMMGFSTASDKTGFATYNGDSGAGFEYRPQMVVNEYIQLEDFEVQESAAVNESVTGVVQTLQYGDGQRMELNIRGITDLTGLYDDCPPLFFENANGLSDARTFLKYLITKSKVEWMPDVDDRDTKFDVLLESTKADQKGTKFRIDNMQGASDYFETGILRFRKVIE